MKSGLTPERKRVMPSELASNTSGLPRHGNDTDVALLIDWENLKWGLLNAYNQAPNVTSIIDAAEAFGRLVTARAYADWTHPRLALDAPNLYRVGIEPIYAQGRHHTDGTPLKNSADVRLAVDAVFLCNQLPHIATYVFVTGDGDLIHPVNFIRLNGKRVVVIAVADAISDMLSSAADSVLLYDRDIEPIAKGPTDPATAAPRETKAIQKVLEALPEIVAERPDKYPFTVLGNTLKSRYGFVARDLGMTFKEFMLRAEREGIVRIATIGNMDYAVLPSREGEVVPSEDTDSEHEIPDLTITRRVSIANLSRGEQVELVRFLEDLEKTSSHLTITFIVAKLLARNVLPSLSEEQSKQLVISLLADGLLMVQREVPVINDRIGANYIRREIAVNREHTIYVELQQPNPTVASA